MTGIRRTLLLAALTVAVFLGTPVAAQAAFSDSITTPSATISTATVAAPGSVTAQTVGCDNSRSQTVRMTWTPSTSARVAAYRVIAYRTNGMVAASSTFSATTTGATVTYDKHGGTLLYTVATLTDYGWTKESPRMEALGALGC